MIPVTYLHRACLCCRTYGIPRASRRDRITARYCTQIFDVKPKLSGVYTNNRHIVIQNFRLGFPLDPLHTPDHSSLHWAVGFSLFGASGVQGQYDGVRGYRTGKNRMGSST